MKKNIARLLAILALIYYPMLLLYIEFYYLMGGIIIFLLCYAIDKLSSEKEGSEPLREGFKEIFMFTLSYQLAAILWLCTKHDFKSQHDYAVTKLDEALKLGYKK